MSDLLMVLGVVSALVILTGLTGCALLLRALHRANRVVGARRSPAPLGWLWSWRQGARLHRRLRGAVHMAEASVAPLSPPGRRERAPYPTTPLHEVAAELSARAVVVDNWLVAANRLPARAGRAQLAALSIEVRDLEGTAHRLQQLCSQWRLSLDRAVAPTSLPPPDLGQRLDAVEAALLELPTGA